MPGDESLIDAWERRVAAAPDAPALRFFDTVITARDLDRDATALAAALEARGIGRGDRVGIYLQNIPQYVLTLLALWRRGAAAALMNPMYHGAELRGLIDVSSARGLVVDQALHDQAAAAAEGSTVEWIVSTPARAMGEGDERALGPRDPDGSVGDADLLALIEEYAAARPGAVRTGPEDVALISYTSGTTGPPKGAMNTHANLLAVADSCAEWMELSPEDVVLCVAPMFHITGSVITMTTPLLRGCTVDLIGRTHPAVVREAIATHGVTTTTGSITVFNGLARLPEVSGADFAGVRHLYSGGAPVPPATVERFRDDLGCYIHNIYGMTETSSAVIGVPPGQQAPVDPETGSLSIGLPLPGVRVRIVDTEGRPVEAGSHGELEVAGPSIIAGYVDQPEETAQAIRDGWLRTGDGAMIDQDGWVYIVDRLKDQINVSGYKVWPREVEDALVAHPGVHEAAVVGEPDDYQGERVAAFVTRRDPEDAGVTEDALIAHVQERLAAYKVPRRVQFVEELPKTATGKIRRTALRDQR